MVGKGEYPYNSEIRFKKKEVLQVQQENPVEGILLKAFKLLPFDYERDKGFCSI